MDKSDKTFLFIAFIFGVLLISMVGSNYYPNHTEEITVKKVVSDKNQWGLVTTSDEFYNINFKTYATIEEGCTYIGIVTNPMFMEKYIDHLVLVDKCGDE